MSSNTFPVVAPPPLTRATYGRPKIALVAGGLGVYWRQFDGLLPTLQKSAAVIADRITAIGAEVEDFGFISDPADGAAVAERVRGSGHDLIVLFVSTYLPSAQVIPLFKYGGAPVLLLCLQPGPSMDHDTFGTGEWLSFAGSAALPEMCVALERLGLPARSVSAISTTSALGPRSAVTSVLPPWCPTCAGPGSGCSDTSTPGCSTSPRTSRRSTPLSGVTWRSSS